MRSKNFLSVFIFVFICSFNVNYSYSIEADVFVQSTVNRASQALNNKFSKDEKIEKLKNIANETVDINGIGLYTLGSFRKSINEEQKKQYNTLFKAVSYTHLTLPTILLV